MRKTQTILALFVLATIFTSCRKSYSCLCVSTYRKDKGPKLGYIRYDLSEYDRKTANKSCKTRQTKIKYNDGTVQVTNCNIE